MATGTATIDFGAWPGGNTCELAITGQAAILTTSLVEAFIMGDSTADHNVDEHLLAPFRLVCGVPTAATGFTIYATSDLVLTGTFKVRWVWT